MPLTVRVIIGRFSSSVASMLVATLDGVTSMSGAAPVALGGSEELKRRYLGMLTEDFKLASFCLTEPDAGSDVSGMRTRAKRQGDKAGGKREAHPPG